ncbi:hypothetical protein IAT38_002892 [Cryptococcus sp. DSM 104549]
MATRRRSPPAQTVTQTEVEAGPSTSEEASSPPVGVLRLRGAPTKQRKVVWSEGTVDNEGMGKKKSKICCIYHKPRPYDESSSDESSSDESDSDARGASRQSAGPGQGQRHRDGAGGGQEVEEESSESEGGGGDGRARPARKPRRHQHSHKCDHSKHGHKPNKYDVQPGAEGKGKGKE